MRTREHWEACKELPSYHSAQSLAFQLKEAVRKKGFDPNGIKVLDKEQADLSGSFADAQVKWCEGPENWTRNLDIYTVPGVHFVIEDDVTISFYDI